MGLTDDLDKIMLGTKLERFLPPLPSAKHTVDSLTEHLLSPHPEWVCDLGWSEEKGEVELFDEQRGNLHIMGAPRQGKSKFLELLLRHGIDNGFGACFLDASENGETMYKVLAYAIKKGYEKVVLIDPFDVNESTFNIVPTINPIHYGAPASTVASRLSEILRISWHQKGFDQTPRIEKFLPAVMTALHAAHMTLAETRYFIDRDTNIDKRAKIISKLPDGDEKSFLLSAFKNVKEWEGFLPTVNRFLPLRDPTLELILGSNRQINSKPAQMNFQKLIAEKYLILVNLGSAETVWSVKQQVVFGTMILSMLRHAILRLTKPRMDKKPWKGKYYVYIDECGLFATEQLAHFLYYMPKTGMTFTFAHHDTNQFRDKEVLAAVRNTAALKALFYVGDDSDRRLMLKDLGYGGELDDRQVSFALARLKKQEVAWRNNRQEPFFFTIRDLPDIKVKPEVMTDFKKKIYAREEFYRTPAEVRAEIDSRFAFTKTTQFVRRDNLVAAQDRTDAVAQRGEGNDVRPSRPARSAGRQGQPRPAPDRSENRAPERDSPGIQVRGDVRPDFTDVETARKRRGGNKEQGDKLEGGEGKP